MSDDKINSTHQNDEDQISASDYVRMEADFISGLSEKKLSLLEASQSKSILIYCQSYILLQEIATDLKSALDSDVEVLTTTDKAVAIKLINSGEVDLLLHGPSSELLSADLKSKKTTSRAYIGSALVLMKNPNPEIEAWMNNPENSRYLTNAISRLNGNRSLEQ